MNKPTRPPAGGASKTWHTRAPACSYGVIAESGKIQRPCPVCLSQGLNGCGAIDPAAMERLGRIISRQSIPARTTVVCEGEPAETVSVISRGVAAAAKYLPDGRRQIVGFLYERDLIGVPYEDAYFSTVEAITDLQVCSFPRREFEAVMHDHASLEMSLLHVISNELVEAQEHMAVLGRLNNRERLASFICRTAQRQRLFAPERETVLLPMSRYDIADYLGMSMENVSRGLRQFEREQLISLTTPHEVKILNRAAMIEAGQPDG